MQILSLVAAGLAVTAALGAADTAWHQVEPIDSAPHEFTLRMEGTADGENTRDPIVYAAWKQGFEPMRFVRLENVGETDIVNPWVLVNGKRNWRTAASIADEALRTYGDPRRMTDAEKARAIWDFQRHHRFHATTGDLEVRDPVKLYNIYGYALCGDNAPVLADLWRLAGFRTRRGYPIGHCVSEAWYEGAWHMLDADESVIFLDRDNRTIASEKEVARDHDLARRAYPDGLLAAMYSYDAAHAGDYPSHIGHSMNLTLRPGEMLEWRWDHAGKFHHAPEPALYLLKTDLKQWGEDAWAALSNGRWSYAPPLRRVAGQMSAAAENVKWAASADEPAASAANPALPARLSWKMEAPYAIVGGRLDARVRSGSYVFRISLDNRVWTEVGRAGVEVAGKHTVRADASVAGRDSAHADAAAETKISQNLDLWFPNRGPAVYGYFLQAEWRGAAAGIDTITIENDLQMARLSLPALELGDNRIVYSDESKTARAARVTFDWVERSSVPAPAAPQSAFYPAHGAEVEGTGFTFRWSEAADKTSAYHFQLSDDPGMRFALSPALDVMVAGKPEFAMPSEGLLNPGQRYYWRVRAKSGGVWGRWSGIWSFVPQGPGVPLHVRLDPGGPDSLLLRWDANPSGRPAVQFRIYAGNEKGFTASDQPYAVATGNQESRGLFPGGKSKVFPANRLAVTSGTGFKLVPQHAFYRVVAIDEKGNRSGASAYGAAPRPFIYSAPPAEVRVGESYRYEVKTIASIGDLTYRDFGPEQSYQAAFWDADQPKFSLDVEMPRCGNFDPKWLRIDLATGVVSGTPGADDSGEYQINVKVEIPGAGTYLQSYPLIVRR